MLILYNFTQTQKYFTLALLVLLVTNIMSDPAIVESWKMLFFSQWVFIEKLFVAVVGVQRAVGSCPAQDFLPPRAPAWSAPTGHYKKYVEIKYTIADT